MRAELSVKEIIEAEILFEHSSPSSAQFQRPGVGSSVHICLLGAPDGESSPKYFFSLLLSVLSINSCLSALGLMKANA